MAHGNLGKEIFQMAEIHDQRGISLHDGELVNLSIDRSSSIARLSFRLESGQLHTAELIGLKAFRCADLTVQNVVSRVLRSSDKALTVEGLNYWLDWVTSLSDAPSWLSDVRKQEWLNQLNQGGLDLVVFEPSAGAEVAGVCERFLIV
jgi:hypothetical protein